MIPGVFQTVACRMLLLGVLTLSLIGCDQSDSQVKHPDDDTDVVALAGCRSKGLTTTAQFEMRGNDQILRLKCGTEKIPETSGAGKGEPQ